MKRILFVALMVVAGFAQAVENIEMTAEQCKDARSAMWERKEYKNVAVHYHIDTSPASTLFKFADLVDMWFGPDKVIHFMCREAPWAKPQGKGILQIASRKEWDDTIKVLNEQQNKRQQDGIDILKKSGI